MATPTLAAVGADMVLLVMLPADDEVMIVQTKPSQTVAELEAFIVAEHARVFPHKTPLARGAVRVQKCVPMAQVVNRRKRSHEQVTGTATAASGKSAPSQAQHSFVELSKTVQVGNVFTNMEQIYVVLNSSSSATSLALPSPAQLGEGKKKKKAKKDAMVNGNAQEEVAVPEPTPAVEKKSKAAADKNEKAAVDVEEKEKKDLTVVPATTAAAAPTKRGRKARKASVDASTVKPAETSTSAPEEPATSEPPAKKAKASPAAKKDIGKVAELAATETADATEAAPAKGRKKKQPATESDDTAPPAAKRAKTSKPAADEKKESTPPVAKPPAKKLSYKETLALAKERIEAEKRVKLTQENREIEPSRTPETSPKESEEEKEQVVAVPVKAKKAKKTEAAANGTKDPKVTKDAAAPAVTTKPKKAANATEASPKANGTKAAKEAIKAAEDALKNDDAKKPAASAKRSFQKILAATRARLDAEKSAQKHSDSSDGEETTDNSVVAPATKPSAKTLVPTDSPVSADSSDTDFEDAKPTLRPVPTVVKKSASKTTKAADMSSDDSTDDEGLDYSQSLLADLTKEDKPTKKTSPLPASQSSTASTEPEKKPRGRAPRKTKVVLPAEDTDVAPESSQETTADLSQDMLSQKNPESKSVLVSSLSKNRFSLDTIPVAKLKKTSKNPFAAASSKPAKSSDAPKRPRGRPPKAKSAE